MLGIANAQERTSSSSENVGASLENTDIIWLLIEVAVQSKSHPEVISSAHAQVQVSAGSMRLCKICYFDGLVFMQLMFRNVPVHNMLLKSRWETIFSIFSR